MPEPKSICPCPRLDIHRAVREEKQMPAQRVLAKAIAHQSIQSLEPLPHVYSFHSQIDLGRRSEPEHLRGLG